MRRNLRPSNSSPKTGSIKRKLIVSTVVPIVCLVVVWRRYYDFYDAAADEYHLLDTLQPMAREASKNVENSLHMLVDPDDGFGRRRGVYQPGDGKQCQAGSSAACQGNLRVLYIGLYDLQGNLVVGDGSADPRLLRLLCSNRSRKQAILSFMIYR